MDSPAPRHATCVSSLKLLGDYWTLRIVDELQHASMRYCELQRAVDNLNPVTLTARLKKLEGAGLINRSEALLDHGIVTYSLTERGQGVLPILEAIDEFSVQADLATPGKS